MSTAIIEVKGVCGRAVNEIRDALDCEDIDASIKTLFELDVTKPPVYFVASFVDHWASSLGLLDAVRRMVRLRYVTSSKDESVFFAGSVEELGFDRTHVGKYWSTARQALDSAENCIASTEYDWLTPKAVLILIRGLTGSAKNEDYFDARFVQ